MKKYPWLRQIVCGVFCLLVVMGSGAADALASPPAVSGPYGLQADMPVIITEVQTGSSSSGKSDEFIELYNASGGTVDIAGWQVRYLNASNETATPSLVATLTASSDGTLLLPAHGYYLLHTASLVTGTLPGQTFDAKLSNADKAVMLLSPDETTCTYVIQDSVGWGATTKAEGAAPQVAAADKNAERLLVRLRDPNGFYLDTNTSVSDTKVLAAVAGVSGLSQAATPGVATTLTATLDAALNVTAMPQYDPMTISGCQIPDPDPVDAPPLITSSSLEPPATVTAPPDDSLADGTAVPTSSRPQYPAADVGLAAPQFTEVLPNPAAPQTDAADEFIELYNPNGVSFDLTGFSLEVGTTTKRHYVFPAGSLLESQVFKAYFPGETKVSLANSGSEVRLLDPFGNVVAGAEPYGVAKEGQAWARANGVWGWTITPTPNAANVVTLASKVASKSSTAKTKAVASAKSSAATSRSTAKKVTAKEQPAMVSTASLETDTPLHPLILGVIGVAAVLYAIYEYRYDLANYIYRIRRYRENRRSSRPEP